MLNCLQATRLIEFRNDVVLSWGQALALRIHLRLCPLCRRYNTQSRLINLIAAASKSEWIQARLSADFKAQLRLRLEEGLDAG